MVKSGAPSPRFSPCLLLGVHLKEARKSETAARQTFTDLSQTQGHRTVELLSEVDEWSNFKFSFIKQGYFCLMREEVNNLHELVKQ